jgi:hypothetical protein
MECLPFPCLPSFIKGTFLVPFPCCLEVDLSPSVGYITNKEVFTGIILANLRIASLGVISLVVLLASFIIVINMVAMEA